EEAAPAHRRVSRLHATRLLRWLLRALERGGARVADRSGRPHPSDRRRGPDRRHGQRPAQVAHGPRLTPTSTERRELAGTVLLDVVLPEPGALRAIPAAAAARCRLHPTGQTRGGEVEAVIRGDHPDPLGAGVEHVVFVSWKEAPWHVQRDDRVATGPRGVEARAERLDHLRDARQLLHGARVGVGERDEPELKALNALGPEVGDPTP